MFIVRLEATDPPRAATTLPLKARYHRAVSRARLAHGVVGLLAALAVLGASLGPGAAAGAATSPASPPQRATPKWIQRIEQVVGDRPMSVVVGQDGDSWFRHLAWVRRSPASHEKL